MKSITNIKYFLLVLFILILPFSYSNGQEKEVAVISNPKGSPAEMTMKELKSVMKGEKQRWSDGTKVVIAFLKTATPAGTAAARKVLGMSGDELNKYWLALVFQGKAKAPSFFNTSAELEIFVAQTPGAIGVIESSAEIKTNIISVDGKKSF